MSQRRLANTLGTNEGHLLRSKENIIAMKTMEELAVNNILTCSAPPAMSYIICNIKTVSFTCTELPVMTSAPEAQRALS